MRHTFKRLSGTLIHSVHITLQQKRLDFLVLRLIRNSQDHQHVHIVCRSHKRWQIPPLNFRHGKLGRSNAQPNHHLGDERLFRLQTHSGLPDY
jgi:hypothetical protein